MPQMECTYREYFRNSCGVVVVQTVKMWQIISVVSVLASGIGVLCLTDELIAKGKWLVESIAKCPDPEQYLFDVEVKRKKMNRTHDGFFIALDMKEEINDDFGINVEMCIKVDGGCKLVQVLVDPCFCDFIMRSAADNFAKLLSMAGLPHYDCPVPKGVYEINDYMFDYSELPEEAILGRFQATSYLTRGGENVGCIICDLAFDKVDDDDD